MCLIENRNVGWFVNLNEMYRLIWEINLFYVLKRIDGYIFYDVFCCILGDYILWILLFVFVKEVIIYVLVIC